MNRIVVTGSTGHVGGHVVSEWLDSGAPVRTLTRHPGSAVLLRKVRGRSSESKPKPAISGEVHRLRPPKPATRAEVVHRFDSGSTPGAVTRRVRVRASRTESGSPRRSDAGCPR
jgi:nucleoside-diphosphate-sugar epimerase